MSIYETLKPRIRGACRDMLHGSEYTYGLCGISGAVYVYNSNDCASPPEYWALKDATRQAFAAPTSRPALVSLGVACMPTRGSNHAGVFQ